MDEARAAPLGKQEPGSHVGFYSTPPLRGERVARRGLSADLFAGVANVTRPCCSMALGFY